MKVILNTDIAGLGEEGNIVVVSSGYARNFLLPQKKVSPYNNQNLSVLNSRKRAINRRKEELRTKNLSFKDRLEGQTITLPVKVSEKGQLYGAITGTVLADAIEQMGVSVPKKQIIIPHHTIKHVGEYTVEARLSHGVSAKFTVQVVSDVASDANNNVPTTSTKESDIATHDTAVDTTTETEAEDLAPIEERDKDINNSTEDSDNE